MIVLDLPYPPTVNHYWRHAVIKGRATVYVSKEGKDYRQKVVGLASGVGSVPGRVSVAITAFMPDRRKRDLDNINKALLDALVHAGVIEDDGNIDKITVERGPVIKGGYVRVSIMEAA